MQPFVRKTLFFSLILICLFAPKLSSAFALALGLAFGLAVKHPYAGVSKNWTPKLLSNAVVGLGASVNLELALKTGASGFLYTAIGIALTLALGWALGKFLKQNARIATLLSVGTAICGGSAIAAVAPVLKARQEEISLALSAVFLLNAVALFVFPPIGHALQLSQEQFGLWAALAIHDTSSVVGATLAYGDRALQVGTTVKLARALWIVPVTFLVGYLVARTRSREKANEATAPKKYPWFILGFLVMAALNTWIPDFALVGSALSAAAKRLMVLCLFLIGSNINLGLLKGLGPKVFMHAIGLWIIVGGTTLYCVWSGLIPTSFP